jgi:small GTP-binding protein
MSTQAQPKPKKPHIVKIAILGDGACGKSSLIRAKQKKMFKEENALTVGVDIQCLPFENKQIQNADATFLTVDLGGQKRFQFLHDSYIKGIRLGVLMYDLSRYITFLNLPKWYALVQQENIAIPVIIVGTKLDLVDDDHKQYFVDEFERARKLYPNPQNIQGHYFISSKTGEGVDELFLQCENLMKMAM